jgi:hypothetical protein
MDRRQFLVRAAATVGAIITPRFVREAKGYIEHRAGPLLVPPAEPAIRTLTAVCTSRGYGLYLGDPTECAPTYTWCEFAEEQGYDGRQDALAFIVEQNDVTLREARAMIDEEVADWRVSEWWDPTYSPSALAFEYLDELDLGPDFGECGRARGEISFIEGYRPGDSTVIVEVADDLSLSLLQARLNELGEHTTIVLGSF